MGILRRSTIASPEKLMKKLEEKKKQIIENDIKKIDEQTTNLKFDTTELSIQKIIAMDLNKVTTNRMEINDKYKLWHDNMLYYYENQFASKREQLSKQAAEYIKSLKYDEANKCTKELDEIKQKIAQGMIEYTWTYNTEPLKGAVSINPNNSYTFKNKYEEQINEMKRQAVKIQSKIESIASMLREKENNMITKAQLRKAERKYEKIKQNTSEMERKYAHIRNNKQELLDHYKKKYADKYKKAKIKLWNKYEDLKSNYKYKERKKEQARYTEFNQRKNEFYQTAADVMHKQIQYAKDKANRIVRATELYKTCRGSQQAKAHLMNVIQNTNV